jgi:DNA-binding beta-propeller fold protein YncE
MRLPVLAALLLSATFASAQSGVVSTVAGIAGAPGLRDGHVFQSQFNRPTWLDVDRATGAIYVVDRVNQALRRIAGLTVSTLPVQEPRWWPDAGTLQFDFGGAYGGGIAIEPSGAGCGGGEYGYGMFLSSSAAHQVFFVVEVGQSLHLAQRDDTAAIIGTGAAGNRDGQADVAEFSFLGDVALSWNYVGLSRTYPTDKLYIADTANHTIRRIRYSMSFESCPQPRHVETLAGSAGEAGSADGPAEAARFNNPRGIAAAPDGSVYVADTGNHTIRRIAADGTVTTVAGQAGVAGFRDGVATNALLSSPSGIDINELGEVFIADTGNFIVRKLTTDGRLITIAGTPGVSGYRDGAALKAQFSGAIGLRVVDNAVYLADTANNVIRKLDLDAVIAPRRRAVGH